MNVITEISSKKYLVWLVSLTLLFSISSGNSGSVSSTPIKHLRQTELTLCHRLQKSILNFPITISGMQTIHPSEFQRIFSFRNRIAEHTQTLSLLLKKSNIHLISSLPAKGVLHPTNSSNEDEHPSYLKG